MLQLKLPQMEFDWKYINFKTTELTIDLLNGLKTW